MNIGNIVRKKVKGLEEEKSSVIKKHDVVDVISLILAVAGISIAALCAFSAMWFITFPCLGFGAGMASLNVANRKKANAKKERIDGEETHLEKLTKQPFNASREMYQKRADKVATLSGSLDEMNETVAVKNVYDVLLTIGLIASTVAGLALGGTFLCAIPMICAAFKGINDILCVRNVQNREKIKNRVDNLKNDLEIHTNILQQQRNGSAMPNPSINHTCSRDLSHTRDYSREDLEAVDSYVESLANEQEQKAYQKVKC